MNQQVFTAIQGATPEEIAFLDNITKNMSDEKVSKFLMYYSGSRKSPDHILLFCLLGLISLAGVHRFVLGNIGMGILYLFTGGLCLIGTIVDAVNHKKLANQYNFVQAQKALALIGA